MNQTRDQSKLIASLARANEDLTSTRLYRASIAISRTILATGL